MQPSKANISTVIRKLIRYVNSKELRTSPEEKASGWEDICRRVKAERKSSSRRLYIALSASAAILIFIISIGHHYYISIPGPEPLISTVSPIKTDWDASEEVLLILSENENVEITSEKEVSYNKNGTIRIDGREIKKTNGSSKAEFNQLIVPKGKRTQVVLSDGTKVWVNSDSYITYPRQFETAKREIYVEGEAYLEVTRDQSAPFILKTAHFEIEVLGTSFNVSSYTKEKESSVVLVKGSVNIRNEKRQQVLSPNQRITVTGNDLSDITWVDVSKYICWRDNMLIFEDDPLAYVFSKLSLYYDQVFIIEPAAESLLISGKLDLKEDIQEVLKVISFSTPVSYEKTANGIKIKRAD